MGIPGIYHSQTYVVNPPTNESKMEAITTTLNNGRKFLVKKAGEAKESVNQIKNSIAQFFSQAKEAMRNGFNTVIDQLSYQNNQARSQTKTSTQETTQHKSVEISQEVIQKAKASITSLPFALKLFDTSSRLTPEEGQMRQAVIGAMDKKYSPENYEILAIASEALEVNSNTEKLQYKQNEQAVDHLHTCLTAKENGDTPEGLTYHPNISAVFKTDILNAKTEDDKLTAVINCLSKHVNFVSNNFS